MVWKVAYRTLLVAFVLTAALNVLQVRAGFLTSYLADLVVPSLIYLSSRSLGVRQRPLPVLAWLGRSPHRAAAVLFAASAATEVSQHYWPQGVFRGRYDPWDIVAYGTGLLVCYLSDVRRAAVR
jgi:hypothetical protein